jgi:DNA polymerase-3 subunit alpha
MVWGKVDRRDDQVQFIIDDAEPIEAVRMVMVELDPKLASDISERQRLKEVLLEHQGDKDKAKVSIIGIVSNYNQRCVVGFGSQFRIQDDQLVVSALARAGFRARIASLTSA